MDKKIFETYLAILNEELVPAMGCTEPIAIAYVAALARKTLGIMPSKCKVLCSGNIIKNAMGVVVPNSGGRRGIEVAATLGIIAGNSDKGLQVIEGVKPEDIQTMNQLLSSRFCECEIVEGVENLFIEVRVSDNEGHYATAQVKDKHTNITLLQKDSEVLISNKGAGENNINKADRSLLSVKSILEFADKVALSQIEPCFSQQIKYNSSIAEEGLNHDFGASVGSTILKKDEHSIRNRAIALAAAGSDARMGGCSLPVVINSGSGNQGITVSVPVIEYARAFNISEEKLYRALAVSNLISIHQKRYIGSLSAYCGATSAACGAVSGIAYMLGDNYEVISKLITNMISTVGGMVCDGAKSSCASKIATALECAFLSWDMAKLDRTFQPGEGLVKNDVEETIKSVGRMGKEGMHATDLEILHIMLDK